MNTYTALIVDDEPHARRFLKTLLEKDQSIQVLGTCANGNEALNFCKNKQPDIILLDIQMPGISGLEVAYKLRNTGPIIIFSTAYDQYAIQAFEVEALDYLIKPFTDKRFSEVLIRAKKMVDLSQREEFSERVERMFQVYGKSTNPAIEEIIIPNKGLEDRVNVKDIQFIEASSVYAILHTRLKQYIYRTTLELLAKQLPKNFIRIHRSYILNADFILSHKYLSNNTFSFKMKSEKEIKSSRSYKQAIALFLSNRSA